ncbi:MULTISPECIES: Ig-like domain-containing protein [unclassified Methanoculleus]|mgnify:CR=1 FL=1|uniref:Ig-like domain-containing protein n=2 Tax=Methanoculleus TaxID=45989 RepID=UPI0026007AFE|nr:MULTISPECIES: Ig-like domain-containing protein [unclassified Methanoculleus]MCK9319005.1 Ig-like domain-containing protein [Methanoculleus sp.]MDD2254561.1 Ig-like domain-containing protein [Methanoculleus sp.]MDD2787407.1 Ig-like domain-containing protein [Methanoculleus sp.]HOI58931.1 Ig-like domain-containing protein [Methanoculleus sp.]
MAKHTHLALLCAVVIIGLLISPAMAVEAASGEEIYRPFVNAQERPDIDGDMIVWEDDRNGNKDIYFGTVDEFRNKSPSPYIYVGERITSDDASQEKPSISGDYIVWQDNRDGNWDIYLYQRSTTTTTQLTTDTGDQWLPIVRGNHVAWYDDSSGRANIVLYDIAAGAVMATIDSDAKTTIPDGNTEFKPALSEKYVAWIEDADERAWYYDIADETKMPVSATGLRHSWPSLYGSQIAWECYLDRSGIQDPEIYLMDLDNPSGGEQQITNAPGYQVSPALSGNIIAWEDMRDGPRGIYMHDLATGGEGMSVFVPEDPNDEQLYPTAGGTTVAWQRGTGLNSNLYIFVYGTGSVEPAVTTITVTPNTTTLAIDETETFTATVLDQDGETMTGIDLEWASSNETVGTIDSDGTFTALAEGTANVTATADEIAGTATVTVTAGEPDEPVLESIRITPATAVLAINDTRLFAAAALDQDGAVMTGVNVTWASSNETVGTLDTNGTFTALAEGTANVTATADEIAGTATVTVTAEEPDEPVATRIEVAPLTTTATVNETVNFSATVYDQFEAELTDVAVAWASSNETVGTIDANGTFTALAAGITAVTATAGDASASALVTVNDEEPVEPVLESIRITPPGATLAIGDTQRFIVTALDQDGAVMTGVNVTWTSSDETVGTIDANGTFTALAEGTANVTATAENVTATAAIIVNDEEPALASIAVAPSAITLGSGDTATFTATAFDQFGTTMTGVEIAWTSSDEAVGTIGAGGVFSAVADGTTTVTATAGNITGTAAVTVTTASSGVAVSPSAITLDRGDSQQFTATVYDPEGNVTPGAEVTWESSDEAVGTIDADGLFTAVAEGTATITATAENETGTATVTVDLPPAPTRIEVEPATATILPGDTQAFTATVFDQRDNEMDWIQVSWSSSDPEVGTIDSAGLFGAFAEGSTDVTASAGDVAGTAAITVSATAVPEPTPGNGGGGGGGGGGDSSPSFSAGIRENLRSGETFTFSELTTTSVSSVNVTAAGTIPKMMLTVKKAKAPSAAEPPAGDVYEYIEITPYWVGQNQIGNATVFFTVPADWLESHNATAEDVVLVRYVNGTWESLETEVLGEESGKYNFRATTPGFSTFAIVASPVSVTASAVEINATTEVTETPGVTETSEVTGNVTTEPTTVPATTPATPLVYAPLLAPLAFFLWARKNH